MIPTIPQTQTMPTPGSNLFVLVMDTRGKPLALAPLHQIAQSSMPMEQVRLVTAETNLPDMGTENLPAPVAPSAATFLSLVESALKRLYDPAFLCAHPLSGMRLVSARLGTQQDSATSLERARVVRTLLHQAIEQLRPTGPMPSQSEIPPRVWHPYLILYRAYVEGDKNYEIMRWLQIGEGTFNRTRRSAVQMVAQALGEMEATHA